MKFLFNSWKQFVCGCFILVAVFMLVAFGYIQNNNKHDRRQFNTHAEIITNDLWALSQSGARSYLQLAAHADHYKFLSVSLEGGAPFLQAVAPPLTGIDRILHALHLLPLKTLSTDIVYQNRLIGTLRGEQYLRIIYPLSNIFIVLLLFMFTILFVINLFYSRKLLEQQVRERTTKYRASQRRFKDLVNLLPEMVCETDLQGKITYANQLILERLNIKKSELFQHRIFEYIIPGHLDRARNNFAQVVQGQKQKLEEYTACPGDGTTFPILTRSAPIYNGDNITGVRSVIIDITERHSLEKQLREAQRMKVIGLMAGGVAHDLNNILSGVINYPELILQKLPENSELRRPIEAVKKSGLRAAEVVDDLLTVARGVAAARIVARPNVLITDYMESPEFHRLQSLYPGVSWQTDLDPKVANISCSPTHITKSIMNLMTNAAEAVPINGQITISTTSLPAGERQQDEVLDTGDWTVISVRDNGSGIDLEDLGHIFEPFYTKKVMGRSGTGLGLTVVWNTIQDHDGEVRVHSDKNGTTFSLYLPFTDRQVPETAATGDLQSIQGKGEKILVIDDNSQQRDIAMQLLASLNYQVVVVPSGEAAVEYLRTHFVNLLLLDMLMPPGINGLQTYQQILTIHPQQKAVIASGFSESDDVKRALNLGAKAFIKKPYVMEQLGQVVYTALQ